jgi:hypothetical protein
MISTKVKLFQHCPTPLRRSILCFNANFFFRWYIYVPHTQPPTISHEKNARGVPIPSHNFKRQIKGLFRELYGSFAPGMSLPAVIFAQRVDIHPSVSRKNSFGHSVGLDLRAELFCEWSGIGGMHRADVPGSLRDTITTASIWAPQPPRPLYSPLGSREAQLLLGDVYLHPE